MLMSSGDVEPNPGPNPRFVKDFMVEWWCKILVKREIKVNYYKSKDKSNSNRFPKYRMDIRNIADKMRDN